MNLEDVGYPKSRLCRHLQKSETVLKFCKECNSSLEGDKSYDKE